MEDTEKIYEKLNQIEQNFGIRLVLIVMAFGVGMFLYWKYLLEVIELKAQKCFEKEMRKINEQRIVFPSKTCEK